MAAVYSKAVGQYRKVMLAIAFIHLVVLLLVIATPGGLIWAFNQVSRVVAPQTAAPNVSQMHAASYFYEIYSDRIEKPEGGVKLPNHAFYQSMAAAYLVLVVLLGGLMYASPERYAVTTPLLLIGKAVGGLYGLGFYVWSHHYLVNLLVPIFDFPVAIVIAVFWLRAKSALEKPSGSAPAA